MAYQVLARKWRPKQFDEVVGQTHVTRTLQNALKQNKLAHAYLFTGTRGVGKTSIARLFAKAIRCENRRVDLNPCLECASCSDIDSGSSMDYIEIDGASNNSVDDVRALIENVNYLPMKGQYKIYVVDEVHMLSVSAFNALLKTLEEPPAHVLFILATTDPQKLLGTVISRCQRYDFKNVSIEVLKAHVEKIAALEGIKFSSPLVAQRLAELGKGSVRDMLSIFDQVLGLSGSNQVSEDNLSSALGLAGTDAMRELISSILQGQAKSCATTYGELLDQNIDLKKVCDQILDSFYKIINLIDEQDALYGQGLIRADALKGITVAELFWIYETLVKDFQWALQSMGPDKVVQILLQKICLRRSMLKADDIIVQEVEQSGKSQGEARVRVAPLKEIKKGWGDFLLYLKNIAPATAANLERGNLLQDVDAKTLPLLIHLAFPEDGAVFKEFIDERESYAKLKNHLADFFEVDIEKIEFRTTILSSEEKIQKNFKTQVELDDEVRIGHEENRRQKILNHPYVKEAEKLFNSKIDKIILKE
jgi:DNA polymerase III subunit gamma/tau